MLLQLSSLSQIPGADGVIQASSPQFGSIIGDIYTAGAISVALKLPAQKQKQTDSSNGSPHQKHAQSVALTQLCMFEKS